MYVVEQDVRREEETTVAVHARLSRWLWSRGVGLVVLVLVAVAVGVLVEWLLPALLTRHPSQGMTAAERLTAANDVRGPLVAFLVALGAAGTLWFTARSYLLNQDGHVTDRYTSAVGQLGHDSAHVRVGGIYALERIGNESPKDRRTIIYVLGAFVRGQSRKDRSGPNQPPEEDVIAALRVASRLTANSDAVLDLRGADLRHADLSSLSFVPEERVLLAGADTRGATGLPEDVGSISSAASDGGGRNRT
jgi:hypothetical protein